jgi:hypothetical protein
LLADAFLATRHVLVSHVHPSVAAVVVAAEAVVVVVAVAAVAAATEAIAVTAMAAAVDIAADAADAIVTKISRTKKQNDKGSRVSQLGSLFLWPFPIQRRLVLAVFQTAFYVQAVFETASPFALPTDYCRILERSVL